MLIRPDSLLHAQGANILVDGTGTVKLADFGASKKIEDLATVAMTPGGPCPSIQGTPYWMAPEVIRQTGHGAHHALPQLVGSLSIRSNYVFPLYPSAAVASDLLCPALVHYAG